MTSETAATHKFSHFGICVTDLERSLRFYRDGLGFVDGLELPLDDQAKALLSISGELAATSHFIRLGDVALELLHFRSPAPISSPGPRPMNQLGSTHLSLRVPDVDKVAAVLDKQPQAMVRNTFADCETDIEICGRRFWAARE